MCQHGYQLLAMRLDEGAAERLQRSLQPHAPRKAALNDQRPAFWLPWSPGR
jgi:hypothetical protein